MVDYNYYSGGYGSGDYSYGSSSSSSSSNKSTIGSSGYTSVDAIAKQSSSGLGAKTSSKLDQKGYTPTKSKSTASAKAYQANYGNDDDSPSSPSVVIQASSVATQQAGGSPHVQTKTANPISWYDSDAFNTPDKPVTAYVPPSPSEIESYVYNASKEMEKEQIDNLLAEAMGYSTPAAGLTIVEDRPLTAEERERFKPLLDMAKDRIVPSITTTELPSIQEMQQKEDEAIREAIKQIQNGVPLDQVLTNITDIAYRGEDEAPEETPVGDSFVGGEYQTAEIKPLTKEGILAKLGEVDPETGQPIQSAADVIAKDVANKQGLGAKTTTTVPKFVETFLDGILKSEGLYQEDLEDTGNVVKSDGTVLGTMRGITPRVYAEWTGKSVNDLTVADMKSITEKTARDIYKKEYWEKPKIDKLPENLKEAVFDMYINAGGNAVKILQDIAGLPDSQQDGAIGPITIKAVNDAGITKDQYADRRIQYYKNVVIKDPKKKKYLNGWINRANKYRD